MTPYKSGAAKKNLRQGIRKMEKEMTAAARVRREFRLGRPPRPLPEGEVPQPLHPAVAWQRAKDALSAFRERMIAAGLRPKDAGAVIVYIERGNQDRAQLLELENADKSESDMRGEAFKTLAREDVIALGMIFTQMDQQSNQRAIFPYLFFGLNQRGMAVLRQAAERLQQTLGDVHSAN